MATVGAVRSRHRHVGALPTVGTMLGDVGAAALQVVVDFAVLTKVLAAALAHGERGPHGRFVVRQASRSDAMGEDRIAVRGWMALLATYSPNAGVADIDTDTGQALVHDLEVRRDSEQPV